MFTASLSDSGWVSFYFKSEEDIPFALALFRRNYERLCAVVQRRHASEDEMASRRTNSL